MPVTDAPTPPAPSFYRRLGRFLFQPPSRRVEIAGWIFIAALIIGLRVWVAAAFPSYVWTRDSGSYLSPAVHWLNSGEWITNARRGPVYSLLLAWIFRWGGTLETVATIQAAVGAAVAALTVAALRFWLGRRAFWPLFVCALSYALYSMPLELERLIRNETILTLFATLSFGAWRLTLGGETPADGGADGPGEGSLAWSVVSGLSGGLMHLLKGIFPIYPLIVAGIIGWRWRGRPLRAAALAACFLVPFVLPTAANKLYNRLSGTGRPPEPEAGEMFYGRTAQWTVLAPGSLAPGIKDRIRAQAQSYIERYQRTGKLENNEIVKRTVVPTLKQIIVRERGGTLVMVDQFCWKLAFEAVTHHPWAYLRQVGHDLFTLNFICAQRMRPFNDKTLKNSLRDARKYCLSQYDGADDGPVADGGVPGQDREGANARFFRLEHLAGTIENATARHAWLGRYSRFTVVMGRVFRALSPVFLTTILLPVLLWRSRGRTRSFWLSMALLWYYYLALLSTVGRPLDRYMMPMVPVMFWAIGSAAYLGWERMAARFERYTVLQDG